MKVYIHTLSPFTFILLSSFSHFNFLDSIIDPRASAMAIDSITDETGLMTPLDAPEVCIKREKD